MTAHPDAMIPAPVEFWHPGEYLGWGLSHDRNGWYGATPDFEIDPETGERLAGYWIEASSKEELLLMIEGVEGV